MKLMYVNIENQSNKAEVFYILEFSFSNKEEIESFKSKFKNKFGDGFKIKYNKEKKVLKVIIFSSRDIENIVSINKVFNFLNDNCYL